MSIFKEILSIPKEILSIFFENFVDIFWKFCRYFLKILSIFFENFVDIFKKICRYFQKNLSIFSKKFVDIFVPTPVAALGKSSFLLRDSQNKRVKHAKMKDIKMANIDLDKANAELTVEIECLNEKIIELKAMHIEDL